MKVHANESTYICELAAEFAPPFVVAVSLGLPLAFSFGQRYLSGFVDRVDVGNGIVLPMITAAIATLFITALATLQHVRRALTLQAVEAMR